MARFPIGPLLMAGGAAARSLRASNIEDEEMAARRAAREAQRAEQLADREDRKRRRTLDEALGDMRLREGGYVPTREATGDPRPTIVSGKTLEDVLRATSAAPGIQVPAVGDVRVDRYGSDAGGYRYDRLSDPARMQRAKIRREEREANEPYRTSAQRQLTQAEQMRQRVSELTRGGMALDAANRQARQEFGESVPSLEAAVREPPKVRDARRAATRNRQLMGATTSEIRALNREIGDYPDKADTTSGRIARRDSLGTRRDSLQREADKYSKMATDASAVGNVLPLTDAEPDSRQEALQRDLVEASQAYKRAIAVPGADSASLRQRYARIVASIKAKHGAR